MTPRIRGTYQRCLQILQWAWIPIIAFTALRGVSIILTVFAVQDQVALSPNVPHPGHHVFFSVPASPNFWEASTNWDGQWYRLIAQEGYPRKLPTTSDGTVDMNAWAFYPLYPATARLIMSTAGVPFNVAAPLLNLGVTLIATILIFRLIQDSSTTYVATMSVLALHAHPASPSFQVAYTEGFAFLFVVIGLWSLRRENYAHFALAALALALTRPISITLSATLIAILIYRARTANRATVRSTVQGSALLAASIGVVAMGLWPLVAAITIGKWDAYLLTQRAWPANSSEMGLLGNWIIGPSMQSQWPLVLMAMLIFALALGVAASKPAQSWGPELRIWAVVYVLYILLATRPTSSIMRYLLLTLAPILAITIPLRQVSHLTLRVLAVAFPTLVCLGGIVLQFYWLDLVYAVSADPQPFP